MYKRVAIIGMGAIGTAFTYQLLQRMDDESEIHVFSRRAININHEKIHAHQIDYLSEKSLEEASQRASEKGALDLVIVTIGILHDDEMMPEKALKDLDYKKFAHIFKVNTVIPAMIAKYFLPQLSEEKKSVFAVLSARVGSISDNVLGGWYAYRSSKSALNMIIKTASIEMARRNKQSVVIGLHPGTVDSTLSKPFQSYVSESKLFTPDCAAEKLLSIVNGLTPKESGKVFAWDGEEILP